MNRALAAGIVFAVSFSSAHAEGAFINSGYVYGSTSSSDDGSDYFGFLLENLGDRLDFTQNINLNARAPGYDYGQFYANFSGSIEISLGEIGLTPGYEIKGYEISVAPSVHFSGNGAVNMRLTANGMHLLNNRWAADVQPATPIFLAYTGMVGNTKANDFFLSLSFDGAASCPDETYESCLGGSSANFFLNQVSVKVIATPVPEPECLALVMAGGLAMFGRRLARRTRKYNT